MTGDTSLEEPVGLDTIQLYDRNAEEALLATLIMEPDRITDLNLDPGDLYLNIHKIIYRTMLLMANSNITIDNVTLADWLEKDGTLGEIGGPGYIARLIQSSNGFGTSEYVRIIKERSLRREVLESANKLLKVAYGKDLLNGIDQSSLTLINIKNKAYQSQGRSIKAEEPSSWADLAVIMKNITWSWPHWLPNGMVTIIASESGMGKSSLVLRIAGSFILNWDWPDGTPFKGETGKVLWLEAENAQVIHYKRASDWGLPDWAFMNLFDGEKKELDFDINNPEHQNALLIRAHHPDVMLIILDSLSGATMGKGEKDSESIGPLKFLAGLARDTGKPILITHHYRKRNQFDFQGVNLERLRGSSAIVQVARVVWALDKPDPNAIGWLRLQEIKNNLAKFPTPIGVLIEDSGLRFGMAPESPRIETVADKAADLLLALLDKGPIAYNKIEAEFKSAGISEAYVNRAKSRLKIVAVKKAAGWFWSLPARGEVREEY